jgi:hypothetical protein
MLENENLVTEVAENTEQTAEQTPQPRTYTQEEVDAIVGKAKARTRAKIQKENDRKYGGIIETLKVGMGKESVEEIDNDLRDFYTKKGVNFPQKAEYSAKDIEILARVEAEEIIGSGFEEVIEEADRLKDLGVENMTAKEKAVFLALSNHIKVTEEKNELSKVGIAEDVYNSKEFQDFASQFKENTPIKKIYEIYSQQQPKQQFKTMGSMKNNTADSGGVKDFYSYEEAMKFTKEDFDKNPALLKAVENSMSKWK